MWRQADKGKQSLQNPRSSQDRPNHQVPPDITRQVTYYSQPGNPQSNQWGPQTAATYYQPVSTSNYNPYSSQQPARIAYYDQRPSHNWTPHNSPQKNNPPKITHQYNQQNTGGIIYYQRSNSNTWSPQTSPKKNSPQKKNNQYSPQNSGGIANYQYSDNNTSPQSTPQKNPQKMFHHGSGSSSNIAPQYYQPEQTKRRPPQDEANAVIDAMCSLVPQETQNMDWIMDLEFGPPMTRPQNRHLAYWDSEKKTVMSASQANTVHPDFMKCNERFRGMIVEQYAKRDSRHLAQHTSSHPPQQQMMSYIQGPAHIPPEYQQLYLSMENQKKMQNALRAANIESRAIHRPN